MAKPSPATQRTALAVAGTAATMALLAALVRPADAPPTVCDPQVIYVPQTTTYETTIIKLAPGQTPPPGADLTNLVTHPAPKATPMPPKVIKVHAVTGASGTKP